MKPDPKLLAEICDKIRRELICVAVNNGAGHIAPSLSCVDILVALYYSVMKQKARDPEWDARDRLIFSKAHGCYALYAILADIGVIPKKEWKRFYCSGSSLSGCSEYRPAYGLEAGCGSLGHGLPIAVGQAFGARAQGKRYRVYCLIGDGEMQEGTTWEALQFAVKHCLGNLTVIVDNNRLQAMDLIVNVLDSAEDDNIRRLEGFGLRPVRCDGHDVVRLAKALCPGKASERRLPEVVVADTIKGYGLKHMENVPKFHFRIPSAEELKRERLYGIGA